MNNMNQFLLTVMVFGGINEVICVSASNESAKTIAYHVKKDANTLTRAAKKNAVCLQKRLAKLKKKYEKLLKKLISKNVSRAEREKNKKLNILKRDIEHITNELNDIK